MQDWQYGKKLIYPRGVLLGIIGGGVLPGSPNPDPISDQKVSEKMECPILFSVPSAPPPPSTFYFSPPPLTLTKIIRLLHLLLLPSMNVRENSLFIFNIKRKGASLFTLNQALLNRLLTSLAFLKKPLRPLS